MGKVIDLTKVMQEVVDSDDWDREVLFNPFDWIDGGRPQVASIPVPQGATIDSAEFWARDAGPEDKPKLEVVYSV